MVFDVANGGSQREKERRSALPFPLQYIICARVCVCVCVDCTSHTCIHNYNNRSCWKFFFGCLLINAVKFVQILRKKIFYCCAVHFSCIYASLHAAFVCILSECSVCDICNFQSQQRHISRCCEVMSTRRIHTYRSTHTNSNSQLYQAGLPI